MSTGDDRHNLTGIGLVLTAVLLLSSMDGLIKNMVESGVSVLQVMAMRSWVVLPLLLLWLPRAGGLAALKTRRKGLHLLRVVVGFGAPFCFFQSLSYLPLAETTIIFFGTTFIMTGLSVPVLKEKVGIHRWSAIAVGFVGIVIAADPSGDVSGLGALYAFFGSVFYALLMLITRILGPGEGTFRLVFFFHAWLGLVATVGVFMGWGGVAFVALPVSWSMTGYGGMAGITILVIGGHLSMTRAFSIAPIGLLAPFEYSALVWATLIGFFFWDDVPAPSFWIGAAIVVASGIYMIHRENRLSRGRITEVGPMPVPVPASVAGERN